MKLLENGCPDRLSIRRSSPLYLGGITDLVGLIFEGELRSDCLEYNVPEGWILVRPKGKSYGTDKLHGKVEPFWRREPSRQVRRQLQRTAEK